MIIKVGFDLDKVFVNYPPIIPSWVIDYLYKDHQKKELSYRIPNSRVEQIIRKLSHNHLLRPAIKKNIELLNQISNSKDKYQIFLISSRYKFLEQLTYNILKRYKIFNHFNKIFLNIENSQPHLFKEKIIKSLNLDIYIDDDLDLLKYLSTKIKTTKYFWYNPQKYNANLKTYKITPIENLSEIIKYLPK